MNFKHAAALTAALAAGIVVWGTAAAAGATPSATQDLESRVIYGLRVGECHNVYTRPAVDVDPPRMWATYDTTGRVGQRVAFQSRLYRFDENTRQWALVDKRPWQQSAARNQAPRGFDPGNLTTYVNGTRIFTGAEQGNAATQFMGNTSYFIDYTGRYRVVIDMYWYANAYSTARRLTKWMPIRGELSGDAPPSFDCVIAQ